LLFLSFLSLLNARTIAMSVVRNKYHAQWRILKPVQLAWICMMDRLIIGAILAIVAAQFFVMRMNKSVEVELIHGLVAKCQDGVNVQWIWTQNAQSTAR